MSEIEACPDCYIKRYTKGVKHFSEPCVSCWHEFHHMLGFNNLYHRVVYFSSEHSPSTRLGQDEGLPILAGESSANCEGPSGLSLFWRAQSSLGFVESGWVFSLLFVQLQLLAIPALSHHLLLSGVFVVERNSRRQEVGERHWWGDVRIGEAHSENQVISSLNIIHLICIQEQ